MKVKILEPKPMNLVQIIKSAQNNKEAKVRLQSGRRSLLFSRRESDAADFLHHPE